MRRIVLYGSALFVGIPAAFCHVLTTTQRQPVEPLPPGYREVRLDSDGLSLRAWFLPGAAGRAAAIVVHGMGDSIESFTGSAEHLRRRGHAVLLLDLRAHGGSQGRLTTLGAHERRDVRVAMDHLRAAGLADAGLLMMGHSLGATTVLLASQDQPDLRAVVVEAPFDTYRETVAHHARLYYGLPRWLPLIPITIAMAELRCGFDADDVDAVAAARRIRAPLFAIADGADPRMPERVVRRVFDAHAGPGTFWVAPGAAHTGGAGHPEFWPRVYAFLEQHGV